MICKPIILRFKLLAALRGNPGIGLSAMALAVLAAAGPLGSSGLAHGDVHDQIELVTKQIQATPRDAQLHMRRADLHRAHADWDAALADFEYAYTLNPKWAGVDLARGRTYLEAGWPNMAKMALDRFLAANSNHVEALTMRARALVRLNRRLEAVADFNRVIERVAKPPPELFLERAQALIDSGAAHYPEALRGIDQGLDRLGPLITLRLYAIDLEVRQQRFDSALARVDRIIQDHPRKETWLARRGEVLRAAGRPEEARNAWKAALEALDRLPLGTRSVPAMLELEKRIRAALAETAPTPGNSSSNPSPAQAGP